VTRDAAGEGLRDFLRAQVTALAAKHNRAQEPQYFRAGEIAGLRISNMAAAQVGSGTACVLFDNDGLLAAHFRKPPHLRLFRC
jgi:hypothetical protein